MIDWLLVLFEVLSGLCLFQWLLACCYKNTREACCEDEDEEVDVEIVPCSRILDDCSPLHCGFSFTDSEVHHMEVDLPVDRYADSAVVDTPRAWTAVATRTRLEQHKPMWNAQAGGWVLNFEGRVKEKPL